MEHVKTLIKTKDKAIKSLQTDLSKVNLIKSQNEILKFKIRELKENKNKHRQEMHDISFSPKKEDSIDLLST